MGRSGATARRSCWPARPAPASPARCVELVAATGTRPEHWRLVNSDDFKDELLQQALRDGSYHRRLVPAEVAELEAAGERFHPRELASLVHQESGMLAQRATRRALERGDNLAVDGTLSSERGAHLLLGQLAGRLPGQGRRGGGRRDVVEARVAARWRAGYLAAQHGTAPRERDARARRPLGAPGPSPGRCSRPAGPRSRCAPRWPAASPSATRPVRQYDLYRVRTPDTGPELTDRRGRVDTSPLLLDREAYQAMRAAHASRPADPPARPRRQWARDSADERDRQRIVPPFQFRSVFRPVEVLATFVAINIITL